MRAPSRARIGPTIRRLPRTQVKKHSPTLEVLQTWSGNQPDAPDRELIEKHVVALRTLVSSLN